VSGDLAPGQVTTADLYRELVGLRGDLSKIAVQLEHVDTVNQAADHIHSDHEARIRVLEAARWKLVGACCVVSAAAGSAVSLLGTLAGHH
jgi:hypothetical protein